MNDGVGPLDGSGHRGAVGQRHPEELVRDAVEVLCPADREIVEDPNPVAPIGEEPGDR
jgi:hypothetical protein